MRDARDILRSLKRVLRVFLPSAQVAASEPLVPSEPAVSAETTAPLPSHWFRSAALLDVRGLKVSASELATSPLIVNGVSLSITRGEAVGLVGDSDSGALEIAQCIAGVLPAPAMIRSGSILFNGAELAGLPQWPSSRRRESQIAYLPRDPIGSLDPTVTAGVQLAARLRSSLSLSKPAANERSVELLRQAGVEDPLHAMTVYPRAMSAALAQRVHIAYALADSPHLLVADNPTESLDESDSSDVLDLLRQLPRERDLTMIIVTSSVSVAALICHRVAVVSDGSVVEYASVSDLFGSPKHPYTRALLNAAEGDWPDRPAL
ncbi:ATP-binding cassette domain-containing protein [Cryobacterium sp. PH29-G1]|uniref:ATP-binding cassette domain-containing protein n=1 Tax=Cryobacterium sp. PH29-G1 TaxID=3046211 RepID=UPI0024BA9278|nr:ATP-binding cassette domain-containing protein [Cryobacterium sp. PH29-G1]MDJ0350918.1 ATP-binding cassette domain-containing protein [Cryobacterium sp. PH29-G1]